MGKANKPHKKSIFRNLLSRATREKRYLDELADPDLPKRPIRLSHVLAFLSENIDDRPASDALLDFKSWAMQNSGRSLVVASAIRKATNLKQEREAAKKLLLKDLLLNTKNSTIKQAVDELKKLIPVVVVSRPDTPYPPPGEWVVENEEIWDNWYDYIHHGKQADPRISRKAMHRLDEALLQYDLKPNESAIFEDESGNLIAVVVREFCLSLGALHWANKIVQENVDMEKNVRKEDSGSIVLCGWSAGSRAKTEFDFARNFEDQNLPEDEKREIRYQAASVFALFWNLAKVFGPKEAIDDIEGFIKDKGLYRMDIGIHGGGREQSYTVEVNGVPITFDNAHLAPPQGVFARNYARAIHYEDQPHKWSVAWTTFRDMLKKDMGAHFYLSDYAIRIQSSSNSATFWQPNQWHGTSLPNLPYSEKGGALLQCGLSIVTSERLPGAYEKFLKGSIGAAELRKLVANSEKGLEKAFESLHM